MKLIEAIFASILYFLISYVPLAFMCYLWVKMTYLETNGFLISLMCIGLAFATYVFLKWAITIVKKTKYPMWIKELNSKQSKYIKSFRNIKAKEAAALNIKEDTKLYQYQYFKLIKLFGSPLTWSNEQYKQEGK